MAFKRLTAVTRELLFVIDITLQPGISCIICFNHFEMVLTPTRALAYHCHEKISLVYKKPTASTNLRAHSKETRS